MHYSFTDFSQWKQYNHCHMNREIDFNHCPRCSGTFEKKGPNVLHCSSCGHEYYINPKPCNALILENKKGEILLVKRARDPQKGWWDLPGGFIDLNETAEESMEREAREELHMSLHNIRYFMSAVDTYAYNDVEYQTICFIFLAETHDTELKPADDVSEYDFVAKKDIEIDKIAFPGLRKALVKYLAQYP